MKKLLSVLVIAGAFAAHAETTIAKCTMPKNADMGIDQAVKVTLVSTGDKYRLDFAGGKIEGLVEQDISDAATVQASVGIFGEALYVTDPSVIVSMKAYASVEGAEPEARMFDFLDSNGKHVIWGVLVDGSGSGCK